MATLTKSTFYFRIYYFRLPFAYSLLNEEISQFHNGPIFSKDGGCCDVSNERACVKRTGLEVSWWLFKVQNGFHVVLSANPSNKSPLD